MFSGAIVAIITPFRKGKVDEKSLRQLIEFQIKNGTDGIVPCGTTGESSTLSHEEHDRVIEITIDAVNKRVPVIAGTGSNSTDEALRLTKHAHKRVRMGRCWSVHTITDRPRRAFISISRLSRKVFQFRLYRIIFQAGPVLISCRRLLPDLQK